MKEQLTEIRKLITRNNVKESLNQLFDFVEENEEFEHLSDDIILLQTTNGDLLENEVGNASTPAYKELVKELLQILKSIKNNKNKEALTFQQSTTVGRNIKLITPSTLYMRNFPDLNSDCNPLI